MSQLSPFVRAFRALATSTFIASGRSLATAMEERGRGQETGAMASCTVAQLLNELANALDAAATDLEQQIARDLTRTGRTGEGVSRFINRDEPESADSPDRVG